CGQLPALTGDTTTSAGSCATTTGKVDGVAYPATPSNHQVPVVTASNTATYKTIPDCQDSSGNHLNYTQSSDAFSCGTTSSGGGSGFKIESVQYTPVTVSNTTTETNLMTFTLPASELGNNQALRLTARGVYSSAASSPGNITLAVKVGGAGGSPTLCTTTAGALATSNTNQAWKAEWLVIAEAAPGSSVATEAQGYANLSTGTNADNPQGMPNASTVSWATNASQTIGVSVTFSVASSSNSVTERQFIA